MTAGFKFRQDLSGHGYTGKVKTYSVAAGHATLLAPGDVMRITGTADSDGIQQVDAAAAGETVTGILISIDRNISNLEQSGLPAGTGGTVKLLVDPEAVYEVDVSNGPAVLVDVGTNFDITATAATLQGGLAISNMTVDQNTAAAASGQFRIEGIKDGDVTTTVNTVFAKINESTVSGTVGV